MKYYITEKGEARYTHTYVVEADSFEEAFNKYKEDGFGVVLDDYEYSPDRIEAVTIKDETDTEYVPERYR